MSDLQKPQILKPFTRFCMTIGNLPSSYLVSLTYEEQLLWLCDYLQNTVIPTVNNNGECVTELQNLYLQLKNYVDNYFTNLDVQNEIDAKLDEMATDGTLDNIINQEIFGNINNKLDELENNIFNIIYGKNTINTTNPTITCYGDSNTRFYYGDTSSNGDVSYAYSTFLEQLTTLYPFFFMSKVINCGFPSQTISWALQNYNTYITGNNTNIAIIGFGTNDIKNENTSLDNYITSMTSLINNLLSDNIIPIILGIPWFDSSYASSIDIYNRLEPWNTALKNLCIEKNVSFIDLYNMFNTNTVIWYNEKTTPKRHFSIYAEREIANSLMKILNTLTNINSSKAQIITNNWDDISCGHTIVSCANFRINQFNIENYKPNNYFQALTINEGETITFRTSGRYCFEIYPLENCQFTLNNNPYTINPKTDIDTVFPILKVGNGSLSGSSTQSLSINVISGTLYIKKFTSEYQTIYNKNYNLTQRSLLDINNTTQYRTMKLQYNVNSENFIPIYKNSHNIWVNATTGIRCIGTTTEMNNENLKQITPDKSIFLNTDDNKYYIYSSSDNSWEFLM